jgi:hypothetical protein
MVLARKLLIADSDQLYPFSVKKKLGHPAEFFFNEHGRVRTCNQADLGSTPVKGLFQKSFRHALPAAQADRWKQLLPGFTHPFRALQQAQHPDPFPALGKDIRNRQSQKAIPPIRLPPP